MRRRILSLWCLLFTVLAWGQPRSAAKTEKAAIQRVRNLLVSSFDRSLPNVTLDYFLKYEAEGAPINWETNDCGKQSGNPTVDHNRDLPICVQADVDLKNHGTVVL
jgi:hypothetical protein